MTHPTYGQCDVCGTDARSLYSLRWRDQWAYVCADCRRSITSERVRVLVASGTLR